MQTIGILFIIFISISAGLLIGMILTFILLARKMKAMNEELDAKNRQIEKIFNSKFLSDEV